MGANPMTGTKVIMWQKIAFHMRLVQLGYHDLAHEYSLYVW